MTHLNQLEIVSYVARGAADYTWVEMQPGLEVMARPAMAGHIFLAVSARTASACAAALTRPEWIVSLTTPKVEDLIYERAVVRPEPVQLNPQHFDVTSSEAIAEHSAQLLARIGAAVPSALVACGRNWVLSNELLDYPGQAANYGLFSTTAPYRSANGQFAVWQPLSLEHDLDHWDYSHLLRLVRRRPGIALPAYDEPLRVFELVRACTPLETRIPNQFLRGDTQS